MTSHRASYSRRKSYWRKGNTSGIFPEGLTVVWNSLMLLLLLRALQRTLLKPCKLLNIDGVPICILKIMA